MNQITKKFPSDFLFGVATSAPQVEGGYDADGKGLNIWDVFSRIPNTIADHSTPDIACDMYHRWKDDFRLMKELNIESYRFSFSWSRILPEGKGRVNEKGLDYYRRMIDELHRLDIIPNATLYHWDLPYELEREGGWLNREIVNWYGEYATLLFRTFGKDIPLWTTINEPIASYVGYGMGIFAPRRKGEKFGRQVNHHVLLAHGEGVERFRAENLKDAKVGIVVDIWNHHPFRPNNLEDLQKAELENEKTYRSYLNPIFKGSYTKELWNYMEENHCVPVMEQGDMEKISKPIDFFGLNCYNRVVDCADDTLKQMEDQKSLGGNFMDNGSKFYPKAVYNAIKIMQKNYDIQIPIYITENGTFNCNEEVTQDGKVHDEERIKYLEGFLYWIGQAIEEGADVRGDYVWSLLDNWEWSAGHTYRYGLVHTNYENLSRICKDSAYWYRDFINYNKNNQ